MIRPTDCPECKPEFDNNSFLKFKALEINHESGPADAGEYVDEYLQEFHDNGHSDD